MLFMALLGQQQMKSLINFIFLFVKNLTEEKTWISFALSIEVSKNPDTQKYRKCICGWNAPTEKLIKKCMRLPFLKPLIKKCWRRLEEFYHCIYRPPTRIAKMVGEHYWRKSCFKGHYIDLDWFCGDSPNLEVFYLKI